MADIVRIHPRVPKAVGLGGEARMALAEALKSAKGTAAAAVIVVLGDEGKFVLRVVYNVEKMSSIDVHLRAMKCIDHAANGLLET